MLRKLLINIAIELVNFYKAMVSPFLPMACRYHPTCSQYCIDALKAKGVIKGTLLASYRILRCNPFAKGGYDPVINKGEPNA